MNMTFSFTWPAAWKTMTLAVCLATLLPIQALAQSSSPPAGQPNKEQEKAPQSPETPAKKADAPGQQLPLAPRLRSGPAAPALPTNPLLNVKPQPGADSLQAGKNSATEFGDYRRP